MRTLPAAFALVVALALAGCDQGGDVTLQPPTDTPAPTVTDASPTATDDPTDAATEPVGPQTVEVFYARDTPRGVFVEPETRAPEEPTLGVARSALTLLLTTQPTDPGLENLVPEGTELLDVDLDGTTLIVDLDLPDDLQLGSGYEGAMYQQIVHTGSQFATVETVQILDDGETPESGHLDLSEPGEPDEFALAPIVITDPAEGDEVDAGEITISGNANVYEANLELRLVDPDEEVVEDTFTTATCGTGCRGDWEHTFTVSEPGRWTIVAVEPDVSDGEGAGPYVTERHFTVR